MDDAFSRIRELEGERSVHAEVPSAIAGLSRQLDETDASDAGEVDGMPDAGEADGRTPDAGEAEGGAGGMAASGADDELLL